MRHSSKKWFWQKLSFDAFIIFSSTWLFLFVMESLKEGIVSRYLSLPHLAFALIALGVLAAQFQPFRPDQLKEKKLSKKEILVLIVLSVLIAFLIFWLFALSWPLTIVLIFVTVAALWLGTFALLEV